MLLFDTNDFNSDNPSLDQVHAHNSNMKIILYNC